MSLSAFNWKNFSPRWEFANRQMSSHGNNSVIIVRWFVVVDYESFVSKVVHSVRLHLAHYLPGLWILMDDVWGMFAFLFDKLSFISALAPLDKNISMQIIIERRLARLPSVWREESGRKWNSCAKMSTPWQPQPALTQNPLKTNKGDDKSWRKWKCKLICREQDMKKSDCFFIVRAPFGEDDLIIFQ